MILFGKEHKDRANALAAVCGEKTSAVANLPRSNNGIEPLTCTDSTLTVWGHGNETQFSEMLDVEFGVLIKAWKNKNPQLKTVEIITCNSQHNMQPLSGYAKRVAKFVQEKYKDVKIKTLPGGQHSDDFSILWANHVTSTFCYITAPSKTTFDNANKKLQNIESKNKYDLGLVAAEMAKDRTLSSPNNFTVNGGSLKVLRASLSEIKTN